MQSNIRIYLYDFNNVELTVLTSLNYESLVYENQINGDGYCEFTCRSDDEKLTPANINMYNRVKIYEGSTCMFYGYINDNVYDLNVVKIRAVSISQILKDRIAGSFTAGLTYQATISQIINDINAISNTGITAGTIDIAGLVTKTYTNSDTVEYVIKDLIGKNQLYINPQGVLNVAQVLGNDLSASVVLKYDIRQIENSNLLNFNVRENGQNIVTAILAKDNSVGSAYVNNAPLQAKYGVLEAVKNYYSVSGSPALITEAQRDFQDKTFTPEITLSPKVKDTFNVGDTVSVRIYNKFININTKYQVLTKLVNITGSQKQISIKLNDNTKDLLDYLKDQSKKITELQNN